MIYLLIFWTLRTRSGSLFETMLWWLLSSFFLFLPRNLWELPDDKLRASSILSSSYRGGRVVEDYENGGSPHNNRKIAFGVTYTSTVHVPLVPSLMPSLVIMIIIDVVKVTVYWLLIGELFLRKFRVFQFLYNQW